MHSISQLSLGLPKSQLIWPNKDWEDETHLPPFLCRFIFLDAIHVFLEVSADVAHMGYKKIVGGKVMNGIVYFRLAFIVIQIVT